MTPSALERVNAALEGADAWQVPTNAFAQIYADEARAEAAEVETAGRLAGMPIAVKDLFDVRGHPTTGCCAAISPEPAERDAALVERLRAAGSIVIGKTNMHELAAGVTNLDSACGPTRNPWDRSRMTGGSSGGSAAAVASGVVPLSLVSDTGGSARIPAAFCGMWGLKATTGRLTVDGMMPLAPEMDCAGLIAESTFGLKVGWEALAGTIETVRPPTRGGVLRGGRWERCHVEVRDAIQRAAAHLDAAGVRMRDVDGSDLDDVHHVWNRIAWPSFAERYANLADDPALSDGTASLIRWGHDHRDERPDALARAERVRAWFAKVFDDLDLLLTATTPYAAPQIHATEVDLGDDTTMDIHRGGPAWFTTAANVAGLPAINVPFAWSNEDLPIGVQLIGPHDGEAALLVGGAILQPTGEDGPPPAPEP